MKLDVNTLLVGADPEVFVRDAEAIRIVVGKLGGTKENPLPLSENVSVQEDNVLAEFNIAPAKTESEFSSRIAEALSLLDSRLSTKGLSIEIKSSHHFDLRDLAAGGRQAIMFGCTPDFNAYTGERNMVPSPRTSLRTAGGHVHVGYANPSPEVNKALVRAMDVFLGLPSVFVDKDTERRSMYGKAGCYRDKPYGVEYRSLSNFWLRSDDTRRFVFNNTIQAAKAVAGGWDIPSALHERIQSAINTSDTLLARDLYRELAHA